MRAVRAAVPVACVALLVAGLGADQISRLPPGPVRVADFRIGESIQRELGDGQTHEYSISLESNDFLNVTVEQRDVDVVATLESPSGERIFERDVPSGGYDTESLSFVAPVAGVYRVKLRQADPSAAAGTYRFTLVARRPAIAQDRVRVAAESTLEEGHRLYDKNTRDGYTEAAAKYEAALRLWQTTDQTRGIAQAMYWLGRADGSRGDSDRALTRLTDALALWKSIGDATGEAKTLNRIANVYLTRADAEAALKFALEALPLAAQSGPSLEAVVLSHVRSAYWMLGDRQKEVEYGEIALEMARRLGIKKNLTVELINVGTSRLAIGDYQQSLDYLRQALAVARDAGDRRSEGAALQAIGEVYRQLDRFVEAAEYFTQALTIDEAVGEQRHQASTLNNLGLVLRSMGRSDAALQRFRQALDLHRRIKERANEAIALLNIGALVLDDMGDVAGALGPIAEALAIHRSLSNLDGQARALGLLGKALARNGDRDEAQARFEDALDLSRTIRSPRLEADTLGYIGRLAADRGDLDDATRRFSAAIDVVESQRVRLAGDLRTSFFAANQRLYESEIDVLMRLHERDPEHGHDRRALEVVERGRARGLLDALAETGADLRQTADPTLLQHERGLQVRIDRETERQRNTSAGRDSLAKSASQTTLTTLLAEYEEVRSQIRATSPIYAALTEPVRLSAADIMSQVLDHETVLLEYALGEERSYLWVVTTSGVHSFTLPGRAEIEGAARRLRDLLATRSMPPAADENVDAWRSRLAETEAEVREAAQVLSLALLQPAAALLPGKRLLICPAGALHYVPFGLLPSPNERAPLVESNEITLLPSASTLAALRNLRDKRPAPRRTLAVVADPVFGDRDGRLTRTASRGPAGASVVREIELEWERAARSTDSAAGGSLLPRLNHSRDEAEAILALVPRSDRFEALDFDANREMVIGGGLSDFRIVHLASHAFVNSDHPELSGLALSLVSRQGRPMDGYLRLHHIYNLKLAADLVVLSACQTALGQEIKGEGLVGLARGFMYAGAPRVVASLWTVDDQATAELMKRFYRGMLGPRRLRPSAALREAQVAMRKMPRWESPYYWAAFTIQGEWK